jgi:type I restriction enzyme M protein
MLNSETKRRIDSCRDILVGKVPDPKAQVEQITTALIYKFMDDMDAEAEELGGKPSFFIGKLKEYRWTKLMSKQLSGQERMDMYIRATTAFGKADTLPRLFREIFKDAFLPYRDPETLNLFLKYIDAFSYEHSEDLGDAYEYLLSVLGSQGDAGQFRTPRHIIDFIVEAVDPDINNTILDPACGTAGFLISAFRHIVKKYDGKAGKDKTNRTLTKAERERLIKNITGYDISPDMVRISKVNMYLHNFPEPSIFEYDTLTNEERWNDKFDVILANPPFMSPKGGVRPHSKFFRKELYSSPGTHTSSCGRCWWTMAIYGPSFRCRRECSSLIRV